MLIRRLLPLALPKSVARAAIAHQHEWREAVPVGLVYVHLVGQQRFDSSQCGVRTITHGRNQRCVGLVRKLGDVVCVAPARRVDPVTIGVGRVLGRPRRVRVLGSSSTASSASSGSSAARSVAVIFGRATSFEPQNETCIMKQQVSVLSVCIFILCHVHNHSIRKSSRKEEPKGKGTHNVM